MLKFFKDWGLVIAMITGMVFNHWLAQLAFLTPYLLFAMLLVVYSKLDFRDVRIRRMHLFLALFQFGMGVLIYWVLSLYDPIIGEGALVCLLAPAATTSTVITGMLGGNIALTTTYVLLSNVGIAFLAPFFFSFIGIQSDLPFWESFFKILSYVSPMLLLPLVVSIVLRFWHKGHEFVRQRQGLSFWLWAIALTIIMGKTMNILFLYGKEDLAEVIAVGLASLAVCLLQFVVGRFLGRKYGETVSGGQSLGQKNTILAIWMSQVYLHPVASIGPSMYVVWQNIVNSYQLYIYRRKHRGDS